MAYIAGFNVICIIAMVSFLSTTATADTNYVRWGRTTCPSTCGTSLVYSGRVGGTFYNFQGGAADYLCLPDNPEYSDFTPGVGGTQDRQKTFMALTALNKSPRCVLYHYDVNHEARLYGTEYETAAYNSLGPFGQSHDQHNVPCAICATMARGMQLMIPARVNCPDDSWTKEYSGYLMTDSDLVEGSAFYRTKFICVDGEAENIPGTSGNKQAALLYHVRVAECGAETFPCSAYDPQKEITCVVCSK